MKKIVVVGANHAGTSAINTLLDHSTACQVTVFDANSNISFLGCGMALWIGEQIDGPEGLFYSNKETLEKKGAKIYMETPVTHIDFQGKVVTGLSSTGETIKAEYDELILATGSQPIIPPIPGMDLENVQRVKLYQHAEDVIEKLKSPEINNIAVVGAGYIGVELAEAFQRKGKHVTLVDIADTCLPAYYDTPFTDMMKQNLSDHGIQLAFGETLTAIEGNGKVERIVTDKRIYPVDMVVMAIGFKPNTEIGRDHLALFKNGAYLVDKHQRTSDRAVYAIGDCATVYDNSLKASNYIALATNAVRSAIVAAHNILGTDLASAGVQGSNGIAIYDLKMVSTGLTYAKAIASGFEASYVDYEDYQKPEFIKEDNHKVTLRMVYETHSRRLLGVQMASHYDMSMGIHFFSLAIQQHMTVDQLALVDQFFLPHFNKPYNYMTMASLSAK